MVGSEIIQSVGKRPLKPHLEQIKKHTKRTGAFLSKSPFVCSFMRPSPSTLCAQGGLRPLECDVFGHLQRLQFSTGRLMTPLVLILLMVLVIIMFVFSDFSLRKQKPNPLLCGFKPRCGEQGASRLVVALVPWLPTPRARWATAQRQLGGPGCPSGPALRARPSSLLLPLL